MVVARSAAAKGRHPVNIMAAMQVYLTLTVLLCLFGPIEWRIVNTPLVLFYVIAYQGALWLGYTSGMRSTAGDRRLRPAAQVPVARSRVITRLLFLGIIADVLMMFRMSNTTNLLEIGRLVMVGLTRSSTQYAAYLSDAATGNLLGGPLFSLLVTVMSPLSVVAIVLNVYFYRELRTSGKVMLVLIVLTHVGAKLIAAANEGLFDTAMYIATPAFLRHQSNAMTLSTEKSNRISREAKWTAAVCVSLAVLILVYFTSNIVGRTHANYAFGTLGENKYNPDAAILRFIPDSLEATVVYLSAYLCQGYYGFSLSTSVEWVPMFGTGFSRFIRSNMSALLGTDLSQYTYEARIEDVANWGALRNWHTAYTSWANDVSRIGVILIMYVLGRLIARYYWKATHQARIRAIIIMPLLIAQVLFLPANNKVFVQPTSFLIMICILLYDAVGSLSKSRQGVR